MRFRLRMSLKLVFALLTLVCVYLACWKATWDYASRPVFPLYWDWAIEETHAPIPFVIVKTEVEERFFTAADRRYYLWFFGCGEVCVYSEPVDPAPYQHFEFSSGSSISVKFPKTK